MTSVLLTRVLWIVVPVGYVGLQLVTVAAWPVRYDLLHHTISDLGWTTCTIERRPGGVLETCSPRHAWFNLGGVAVWVLLAGGAAALHRTRPGLRFGRLILLVWLIIAGFGIATCLVPGDVDLVAHSLLAVPIFAGTLTVLVLNAVAWRAESRLISRSAAVLATVTGLGFVGLLLALAGFGPVGLFERLAAESVYLWLLIVALSPALSTATRPRHVRAR